MNRRRYLFSLGALTSIGSATVGTGALTAARLERDATIRVTNDRESLIALVANPKVAGVKEVNGQLAVDLEDPGINVNSIYQFGFFDDDWENTDVDYDAGVEGFPKTMNAPEEREDDEFNSAFLIQNRTQEAIAIDMHLQIVDEPDDAGDTAFVFQTHFRGEERDAIKYVNGDPEMGLSVDEVQPGEAFGVSFFIDAIDGEVGDRLDASLSVQAGAIAAND